MSFLNANSTVLTNLEGIVQRSYSMVRGNFVARDVVGAPSNVKNPVALAELASEFAAKWGLELNVLTEDACRRLGMGAFLGVAQGSRFPPQFMHLTYRPASGRASKKIVLIGKTMTFDSGGYNLKVGVRANAFCSCLSRFIAASVSLTHPRVLVVAHPRTP